MTVSATHLESSRGATAAAISRGMVGLVQEYTGRGPTKARTILDEDTVIVTLAENLTRAEVRLAEGGHTQLVLDSRRAIQQVLGVEAIALVESLTGRTVRAFMSDNCVFPDVAVEVFMLEPRSEADV